MSQKIVFVTIVLVAICLYVPVLHATIESARPNHDKNIVCYVATWAQYRPQKGKFEIDNLRPEYCTHLIYSFAGLNATSWTIRSLDPWADLEDNYGKAGYKKMTALRSQYTGLKVSIAIGGWNEGSANYSALVSSPQRRNIFVTSVVNFIKKYGFDGLDLDWEFPTKRGGSPADRENFVSLIRELNHAFKNYNYLLTAAISADKSTIKEGYDVPQISKYLDFIHVMAYDYHGSWDRRVGANAPLKCSKGGLCIEETINYLLELGAPAQRLVLGLPMYGRTFIMTSRLNDDKQSPIGTASLDVGFRGNYTGEDGFMGYNEICKELMLNPGREWRVGWDEETSTAYAVDKEKVIVYDNAKSIKNKINFVNNMNLAGVMIWSIDTDDFLGECRSIHNDIIDPLLGSDYPMMRVISMALSDTKSNKVEENSVKTQNTVASVNSTATDLFSNIFIVTFCAVILLQKCGL